MSADHYFPILLDTGEDAIDMSVKELSNPDDGISFSEKQMSQKTLASKNGHRIVQGRGSTAKNGVGSGITAPGSGITSRGIRGSALQ